ncbi:MAG: TIR domain-containing protein [Halobacteriota archaeon]|nr:TIR domain-containing protein [Halobacteriota archaeon]
MARRVFFSFHYDERDVWRAGQIRNSWVTKPDREYAGFWDAAAWEEVKKKGEKAIKRWIDKQLEGTSVTVVLIGAETNESKYVDYEIEQSRKRGNGLLAIYIHKLKDKNGNTDTKGKNPFDYWHTTINEEKKFFSSIYSTFDWVDDDGYNNLGDWVENAAKKAGR